MDQIAALPARKLFIVLSGFTALSAIAGGIELLAFRNGNQYVPIELIRHTPFHNFLIPGLLLGLVIGGTSLLGMLAFWRRSAVSIDVALLAGGALFLWIAAEWALLLEWSWLQGLYGSLGLAMLAIGVSAAWKGTPRHRWVFVVSFAEMFGFLIPATAGVLTALAEIDGYTQFILLVSAGLLEGLLLGLGQSFSMPLPIRRWRYAALTSIGAGVAWVCIMFAMHSMSKGIWLPSLLLLPGLLSIGTAQWIELRHHSQHAARWMLWTPLAWIAALPFSFAPSPLVDEHTPMLSQLILWSASGLLMAYVMANITWVGVAQITKK